jgi:hypothetical protein
MGENESKVRKVQVRSFRKRRERKKDKEEEGWEPAL